MERTKPLPFADRTPPVKHPADNELTISCLARYFLNTNTNMNE